MKQFSLSGDQMGHVADLLAAGAGKAVGSVDDMANALKYAGVPAHSLGLTLEETTGVLALFASQGIIGEQAGTSFRGMLMSLSAPSKAAQRAMDDLGLTMYDGQGKFIGMQSAAQVLHDKLGPLDEATRNAALGQIFGNEQITAAIALYQAGGKGVKDWADAVNDSGFAARQAATLTDDLRGDIERLGGALDSALIQTGSVANDSLRGLVQGATGAVDMFASLPEPIQSAGVKVAAFGAAGLLAAAGAAKVVDATKSVGEGFDYIASRGPRAERALNGVRSSAVVLGKVMGTLAIAGAANDWLFKEGHGSGANQLAEQINAGADALKVLNGDLALSSASMGLWSDKVDHVGDVLHGVFGQNLLRNSQDEVSGFLNSISAGLVNIRTSGTEAARQLAVIDEKLSGMVAAGQGDAAAQMFSAIQRWTAILLG